jgi:selenocysteine lyase/cysteine desulfurase
MSVNTVHELHRQFTAGPGYLSAATAGLPTHDTAQAMREHLTAWERGALDPGVIGEQVQQCRSHFATLSGVSLDQVAIGSQVSQCVSVVAASLPAGAEVLCATGDFASLVHPFVQQAGLTTRFAPASELASAINDRTTLVAFSLVQSATGVVADHEAIVAAARAHGAQTFVDLTQSLGWYNVGASEFDFTVCHSYKWLCAPRGVTFFTVSGDVNALTPFAAGWYSADDVWASCYAGNMPLAKGASRFDLSPVWPSIGGAEAALRLFSSLDIAAVERYDVELANQARAVLGLTPSNSAIVTWPDPQGEDLHAMTRAGLVAAGRAGNARIAFHLWNTPADIDRLSAALTR